MTRLQRAIMAGLIAFALLTIAQAVWGTLHGPVNREQKR